MLEVVSSIAMMAATGTAMEDRPSKRRCVSQDLQWRTNGESNPSSDWSLIVESTCKLKKKVFSVHRTLLESRSRFFATSSNHCNYHFKFDEVFVAKFHLFLDCIYASDAFCKREAGVFASGIFAKQKTFDQVVLLYLLDHFQAEDLFQEVASYVFEGADMTWGGFLSFYRDLQILPVPFPRFLNLLCKSGAYLLSAKPVVFAEGRPQTRLLKEMDLKFLLYFLQHKDMDRHNNSDYGKYLLTFLKHRRSDISMDAFIKLTGPNNLPYLDAKTSLQLLKLCATYGSHHTDATASFAVKDIQIRCSESIRSARPSHSVQESIQYLKAYADEGTASNVEASFVWADVERACFRTIAKHLVTGMTLDKFDNFMNEHSFLKQDRSALLLLNALTESGKLSSPNKPLISSDFTMALLRHELKTVKVAKASTAPLSVHKAHWSVCGEYVRVRDGLYLGRQSQFLQTRIECNESGTWTLECEGLYNYPSYTSSARSNYEGCPPFTGWRSKGCYGDKDETCNLCIEF